MKKKNYLWGISLVFCMSQMPPLPKGCMQCPDSCPRKGLVPWASAHGAVLLMLRWGWLTDLASRTLGCCSPNVLTLSHRHSRVLVMPECVSFVCPVQRLTRMLPPRAATNCSQSLSFPKDFQSLSLFIYAMYVLFQTAAFLCVHVKSPY